MGKKGSWFSAVKKAFSPEPKEKKDQSSSKSKKKWFGKHKGLDQDISSRETTSSGHAPGVINLTEADNEQTKHAYNVALATAAAAEAAAAAAQAAAEVVRLTAAPRHMGKSKEEIAAIKIQTAFRGYLARRALRALRGLVRLKNLVEGPAARRQANTTLRCMQTMAHVQSQVHARRTRMCEENQALQRQLRKKRERELEKLKMGEDWDHRMQSKEQIEANIASRQEASLRRERALAYSYTHQQSWKNPSKSANLTFMDPNNPHWGWSWLERWTASRPWETRQFADSSSRASVKGITTSTVMPAGDNMRTHSSRDLMPSSVAGKTSRLPNQQSPSTPPSSKTPSLSRSAWGGRVDEDSRSMLSAQSERYSRRHSIAGSSSIRDDESLLSIRSVPSYMAPTQSAKAKSRLPSPLGRERSGLPEKSPMSSTRKRLSFNGSAAGSIRRHSGPPRIESSSVKDTGVHVEDKGSNEEQT